MIQRRCRTTSMRCSRDVLDWATNVGYPGYSNAAIDETFNTWVINTMFAKAATGRRDAGERPQAGRNRDEGDLGEMARPEADLMRPVRTPLRGDPAAKPVLPRNAGSSLPSACVIPMEPSGI